MNPITTHYRGYKLETTQNGEAHSTIASLSGNLKFGTFSHLDELSSVEKMHLKIDSKL